MDLCSNSHSINYFRDRVQTEWFHISSSVVKTEFAVVRATVSVSLHEKQNRTVFRCTKPHWCKNQL